MPLWVHPMGAEIRPKGAREVAQKAAQCIQLTCRVLGCASGCRAGRKAANERRRRCRELN
jgi:hypothetical protein